LIGTTTRLLLRGRRQDSNGSSETFDVLTGAGFIRRDDRAAPRANPVSFSIAGAADVPRAVRGRG